MSTSAITNVLDRLDRRRFIERRRDPADRRSVVVVSTTTSLKTVGADELATAADIT